MKALLALSLFTIALASLLLLTRAGDNVRWETLRVYPLSAAADARSVAVAVPSSWREAGQTSFVGSTLRFVDESGREIAITRADLLHAAAENRVYRPARAEELMLAQRPAR